MRAAAGLRGSGERRLQPGEDPADLLQPGLPVCPALPYPRTSSWDSGPGLETGWDLGPFAAVLQCWHLDTPLLKLQNTKKLYGTKNNGVHVHLGQILDQKIRKTQETSTATSEEPGEEKQWVGSKSSLHATPAKGRADHLSHPSSPTPGHTPTLTPYKEQVLPP